MDLRGMVDLEDDKEKETMVNPIKQSEKGSTSAKVILFLVIIIALLVGIGSCCGNNKPRSGVPDRGDATDACIVCGQFVESRLKSPSTAKFPTCSKMKIENIRSDVWTVIGYVDAQNSFGAMLRSVFLCKVEYKNNDQWKLLDIMIE